MALSNEELQRAIAAYQGSNAPAPVMDVAPAVAALPPDAQPAVVVPPVAPVVEQPPVVQQALPPSAPEVSQLPTPTVTNSTGALREMDAGTEAQLQAEEHKAAAQALANDEQSKLVEKQAALEAAAQADAQKKLDEGRQRVAAIYDQAKAIDSEADKIQVKDRRTTTQKVLGIIGLALSSVADGMSGFSGKQTNFAGNLESSLNAAVDKDLALQREAIQDKRKQSAARYSEMGIAQKLFVDDVESATKYASALRKDMYARELDASAKRSANPVIQAEGAATAAKILQDNAKEKAQLLTSKENARIAAAAAAQRTETTNPDAPYKNMTQAQLQAIKDAGQLPAAGQVVLNGLVAGDNTQGANARKPEVIAQTKGAKFTEDQVVRDPSIAVQFANDADKFQKGLDTVRTMSGLIDAVKADRKLFDAAERAKDVVGMSEIGSRLESNGKLLTLEGKNAYELGALSGPDVGLINSVTGNVKSFTKGADAQLDTMSTNIVKSANQKAYARGLEHPFQTTASTTEAGRGKPQIVAGGKAVKADVAADSNAPVQFNLGGKIGTIPADQAEAFQKKYPSAKRL
jgi:hypothetical protein